MIDHLRREARMSRSGIVNRRTLASTRRTLEMRLGRHASDAEMADALGLSPDAYFAMASSARPLAQASLDEAYSDHDIWFADAADGADSELEKAQFRAALADAIAALGGREATVLQLYFVEEMNLEEIGAAMQVGAARICQIKKAALERLREMLGDWEGE
jgi:RNA polymerase sigma factor for flagellar operon FliA